MLLHWLPGLTDLTSGAAARENVLSDQKVDRVLHQITHIFCLFYDFFYDICNGFKF